LFISPQGVPHVHEAYAEQAVSVDDAVARRIAAAFAASAPQGLLHLATAELEKNLPPGLDFARRLASSYLTRLCQAPDAAQGAEIPPVPPPSQAELDELALAAPPVVGLEYLGGEVLRDWWTGLDALVREQIRAHPGGAQAYLHERHPLWRLVGRVTLHLAENKRDTAHPFAFIATYASRLSAQARLQHQPLSRALQEYAGAHNRQALLSLLTPLERAAERSGLMKELVESGDIYQPLAWTPREAYRYLQEIPLLEESGLIVRVPDWWKAHRPPRPIVSVKVGDAAGGALDAASLLDFSVDVALDGEPLTSSELQALLASSDGLVSLKGKWVEVDRDQLSQALDHWKKLEKEVASGGLSFFEGMRLLSGATLPGDEVAKVALATREWTGITASESLERTLEELRQGDSSSAKIPAGLKASLRPYQMTGVNWLKLTTRLGLGACLADDMGLGKTIQVIALLLDLKQRRANGPPSLLVVPASLIANWKAEIQRFAPTLTVRIVHPSEQRDDVNEGESLDLDRNDLVITTYGMLARLSWLAEQSWQLAILDEAQAIKNAGTRQARAAKQLKASARIALTGTPIENRLSDLWSLFDFLNPGLLGSAKQFSTFVKNLSARNNNAYGPLRTLVRPYILRRLKTDKRVIADLPEKTEVNAYCGLSKQQAALYQKTVAELKAQLDLVAGMQRRGVVLSTLMRLKQLCNHPSQVTGDGAWDPGQSGKFQRLATLCEELAARQERALVFTQFREITAPLAEFLAGVFGRPGLVLHGQTPVGKRRGLVETFQREDGPPFFVLSLKAGGTGLNLTAASHVIHFDRWWNPAVENQATDRAFRIGQQRNVLVHKFVCRGTVEERIDQLIAQKSGLAKDLLDTSGEVLLTELDNERLLQLVALDIHQALES
jgi:non-specific serine/threonine protein kinase